MKNWDTLNINKKTMIENYKISIFNKNLKEIHLYTCEFICNNHPDLLLEIIIELYLEFYITNNIDIIKNINECIDILKNLKKNEIYLDDNRLLFNNISNDFYYLNKPDNIYYKKKYEIKLQLDPDILLNKLNQFNYNIWENIRQYIPLEQHKYFLELIYYIKKKNNIKFFNLLNTIINKFSKKTKLLKNIETINPTFKDNYIMIFFELFKFYKNSINDAKLNYFYDLYFNIFNWKLKKSNLYNRVSIIFLLFDLILSNKLINSSTIQNDIDIKFINNIYQQLIEFYELPKEKKKKVNKTKQKQTPAKQNNNAKQEENDKNRIEYLYTIIDINNKELQRKSNKVTNNKIKLKREIRNKPINLQCEDRIYSSFTNNEFQIIKNY